MYKVMVNGKQVGEEVITNRSMSDEEVICWALNLDDIEDQETLEKLYNEGCQAVCFEDDYFIPVDDLTIICE